MAIDGTTTVFCRKQKLSASLMIFVVSIGSTNSFELLKRPCPPPRFDTFADVLVSDGWTNVITQETAPVEEVMRSCGGAVQGIREGSLVMTVKDDSTAEDGFYLNRANDGFVFCDDGAFSLGPTSTPPETLGDGDTFLANFMLDRLHRVLIFGTTSSDLFQAKMLRRTKPETTQDHEQTTLSRLSNPAAKKLTCHSIITCSMSNSDSPWMLPRAEWKAESAANMSDIEIGVGRSFDSNTPPPCVEFFGLSMSSHEFSDWTDQSSPATASECVCAGIVVEGTAQVLVRKYNAAGGGLHCVQLVKGLYTS